MDLVKDHERVDELQRNGYKIIQDPEKFCFGIDAVLLSAYAKVRTGEKVLDLGTGTGIIPILMEAKTQAAHLTGLEIQESMVDLATRSVKLNQLEDKIQIVQGDIGDASNIFGASSFDVVTCNPPYMIEHHGLKNPSDAKSIARHELLCSWKDIVRETAKILKVRGRFYIVHRPFRLVELLKDLSDAGLEPKSMRLVYPYVDKEPNMVLIEAIKGGKSRIKVGKPLIVYEKPQVYTQEVLDMYTK